ncbi:GspH/FimT family protein [Candidatus Uhrbacteria bacterium]|nr:GspH/FimT family protein [Candidatus Uhrbacteria bacterium]
MVTAISLPNFGRFLQTWRLHGEVDRMAAALRTARSAAVMRNINTVFQFDLDAGTYFYFEDEDADGQRDSAEYRSATFTLSRGIFIDSQTLGGTTITFGPRGNTMQSGAIVLENGREKTRQITIFGGTGNIRTGT